VDGQAEAAFEEFVLGRQAALFRAAFLLTGDPDNPIAKSP